ncbi:MAG: glycoside hydrolase family 2 protein, partial [Rikenella sp.]|nr:glycoside hydrolase family 2 protein [Rikenella sp.]
MKRHFSLLWGGIFGVLAVGCGSTDAVRLLSEETQRCTQTLVEGWSFREADSAGAQWLAARVPGVVHTDLLAHGRIPEPFAGTTESELQWIGERMWEYRTQFVPTPEVLEQTCQELVFKGLDTYADVYLNDSLVLGGTDNMFVEWRIPVGGILKADTVNTLRVVFHPAYATALPETMAYPVKLPNDNDKGEWKTSVFTRKAPYHFGWDWGPRYLTAGIWRPVYLDAFSVAAIDDVRFVRGARQDSLRGEFTARVSLRGGGSDSQTPVRVIVADSAATHIYGQTDVMVGAAGEAETAVEIPFAIVHPKLWWPNGMGEPNLYTVRTFLIDKNGRLLDRDVQRIGVRTIELVQKPDSVGEGESFQFYVNGEPCFIKGANYIPQDLFLPRVDTARYEALVGTAAESNMNMLRIWGGGIYEEDLFFDLCDERGIML